ncbi:MAG: Gfo/Idh/MocA family oxidoreductase [Thermoguttaceae bacterium]|jgi:predicted dehydrogenase
MQIISDSNSADSVDRSSRRDFLKTTSALAAAGALTGSLSIARGAHAAGSDLLKIGLVGCGDRGSGAAVNALGADKNCKFVAMADAFSDRIPNSLENIKRALGEDAAAKVAVAPDHCFAGLDAAEKLIRSGLIDVVILAEPPHFRPAHLKAAVDAGLQIFCEKPVAVDAPGVRSVMATVEEAKKKNLNLVSGLCWRYDRGVREVMKRVHDGAIGEIKSIQETYLAAPLSYRPRQPQWTEMEHQLRNWQYFVWLSGDFNTEQHVHSLDKASWALREQPPVRAWGVGGRQCRDPKQGNVYDHHAVTYEYPNGVNVHSYCRQIAGCPWYVNDVIVGTKGRAIVLDFRIEGETNWRMPGSRPGAFSSPLAYDVEHVKLFEAIRSGKTINNGHYMAQSTMLGLFGRMVDYTGQILTWQQAINSKQRLAPASYALDAVSPVLRDKDGNYPAAMPGVTRFE